MEWSNIYILINIFLSLQFQSFACVSLVQSKLASCPSDQWLSQVAPVIMAAADMNLEDLKAATLSKVSQEGTT